MSEEKPTRNYVDKAEFTELIRKHRQKHLEALAKGEKPPRIPEEAGRIIMEIAERYSRLYNFRNYPFRDEMIANGIEAAIRAFNNFDPERATSPLAYFTQCIYFSFIGTISKEKKQLYTKIKIIREGIQEFMDVLEHDDSIDSKQKSYLMEFLDKNEHEIEFGFLEKKEKVSNKKEKVIESPIDEFFVQEDQ